ncbi:MAG: coenzyme F420-0:L-glutamate ligase [Austwickia sp.]|nr:coenzyme F420-0:L-glutamate ligase [Austwickia sp.]
MQVWPLTGIPEIVAGDDLAGALAEAIAATVGSVRDGDVLVVSSKVVSKAGGLRADVAQRAALVLRESDRVVAERTTATGITRIVAASAGPVLAGAGIDASNIGPGDEHVLLLPQEPDAAAHSLLLGVAAALEGRGGSNPVARPTRWGVLITDTAGRPWRLGQADISIGAAGVPVVDDLRDGVDADGRALGVTVRAVADELAGAADLVKGKADRVPAALVRGWRWPAAPPEATGAIGADGLVRRGWSDWFALGHVEAVRAALGVPPGTHDALDVGVRSVAPEPMDVRAQRACRLALTDGLGRIPVGHPRAHLAGVRPDLLGARCDLVQYGIVAEAPDEFTLGVLVGRLLPALAAEDVPTAYARTEPPAPGRGPRAVLVFTDVG